VSQGLSREGIGGANSEVQPPRTRILFIFLDGVGLAPGGLGNPLSQVPMPHMRALLGGPLVLPAAWSGPEDGRGHSILGDNGLVFRALDACLGVPGLPQSATGQTALFTGVNAPALVGDHVTAYPTQQLQEVIAGSSVMKQVADEGGKVLFANAHSERFWELIRKKQRRLAASTLTALAANAPIPTLADLAEGRAVLWDFTHEVASRHLGYELEVVSPEQAGIRLARLASYHDLVLYESFLTDLAGHRRLEAEWVLVRLDAFLGSVLAHRTPETTVVVCSDHGNVEDATTKSHTANPVPLVAVGPAARCFETTKAITDVAPAIVSCLAERGLDGSR
jgi:2,3-bisphosphoglycerate-independent phosphoglycerate mutase